MSSNVPLPTSRPVGFFPSEVTLTFQRVRDRLDIECPVMFAGAPVMGEGMVHNLSRSGCTVESAKPILQGSYVMVRLLLPDADRSLTVELAAVRWTRDQYFGLEFLRLPAPDHARLETFLTGRLR